jgi:hypothetical protein
MINALYGNWVRKINSLEPSNILNTPYEILLRDGIRLETEAHINVGAGSHNINVLQLTGAARVVEQYAIITEVTALADMTDVYADLWDGTLSSPLTKSPGATFSGLPVGSMFTKDKVLTEEYSILDASTGIINEISDKDVGFPFLINQKAGADTFIRFNFTTGVGVNFKMQIFFKYQKLNGGSLSFI